MSSRRNRPGFTLIEMMVAVAVLAVVLAIAIPNFLKIWMVGNEGSVIESMRAVGQACESYRMQGTQGGVGEFPPVLRTLTVANPPYLDGRFGAVAGGGVTRGYQWAYQVGPQQSRQVGNKLFQFRDSYTLRADPVWRGVTGQRSFFMDQTAVVRFNVAGPAGSNDTPIEQAEN